MLFGFFCHTLSWTLLRNHSWQGLGGPHAMPGVGTSLLPGSLLSHFLCTCMYARLHFLHLLLKYWFQSSEIKNPLAVSLVIYSVFLHVYNIVIMCITCYQKILIWVIWKSSMIKSSVIIGSKIWGRWAQSSFPLLSDHDSACATLMVHLLDSGRFCAEPQS